MATNPAPTNPLLTLSAVCKKHDLTIQQIAALVVLHSRGGTADFGDVADTVGAFRPTMTRYADKCENLGLLARSGVDGDRRLVTLSLTAAGKKFLRTNIPASLLG